MRLNRENVDAMDKSPSEDRPRKGRPAISAERRADMRLQISDAAGRLFHAEGYGKVSMRRIAAEVGCSPMTLYKYYDAKIDILRSLWAEVFADLFEGLDAIESSDHEPPDHLLDLSVAYVEYWLKHPDRYRLVFMADGVEQPDVTLFLDAPNIVARYGIFAKSIKSASPEPMDSNTLKLALDTLVCSLHGIAHNHVTISGHDWPAPRRMLALTIEGILTL